MEQMPAITLDEWWEGWLWGIFTIFSPISKWHAAECFWLSGDLYRLSNLINKVGRICLLFIFPALPGFACAGKLPFPGTTIPKTLWCFFSFFLTESDERNMGLVIHLQVSWRKKKSDSRYWQTPIRELSFDRRRRRGWNFDMFTLAWNTAHDIRNSGQSHFTLHSICKMYLTG